MPNQPATKKQIAYLLSLLKQHPNYRQSKQTAVVWLNEKYSQYLTTELVSIEDLEDFEASELISRLVDRLGGG